MAMHFGEMLSERRKAKGMSIQQVANIIKIRPQIIEYFETENFAEMPPRGYAQGMISSYARYLGLNPRQVIDAYFDALSEFERDGATHVGRFQDAAADANRRGDTSRGRYLMVNGTSQGSRFGTRPQQAGYVSESSSSHQPVSASQLRPLPIVNGRAGARAPQGSGYDPSARTRTNGRPVGNFDRGQAGMTRPVGAARPGNQDPQGYRPRQGYGQGYDPRAPQGGNRPPQSRRGSYGGERRGTQRGRGGGRGRQGAPQAQRGFDVSALLSNPRIIIAGAAALLLIVVLAFVLLMRGCTSSDAPSDSVGSSTRVSTVTPQTDEDDDASSDEDDADTDDTNSPDAQAADDPIASDGAAAATAEPEQTIVKVSLKEEDTVAWIEIKLDGKSVLAKQVVGPFEQEYTVTSQIDITTDKPSAVSVYKNDEKVRYDTKVSGLAKVTILAPQPDPSTELTFDSDGDGTPDMTTEEAIAAGYEVDTATDSDSGDSSDSE